MSTSDAIRIANQITANWSQTDYYQFAFDRLVNEIINDMNGDYLGYIDSTSTGTDIWEPTQVFG